MEEIIEGKAKTPFNADFKPVGIKSLIRTILICIVTFVPILMAVLTLILALATPFFGVTESIAGEVLKSQYGLFDLIAVLLNIAPKDNLFLLMVDKLSALMPVIFTVLSVLFSLSFAFYALTHIKGLNRKAINLGVYFTAAQMIFSLINVILFAGITKGFFGGADMPSDMPAEMMPKTSVYSYTIVLLCLWAIFFIIFTAIKFLYKDDYVSMSSGVKRQKEMFINLIYLASIFFFPPLFLFYVPIGIFDALNALSNSREKCPKQYIIDNLPQEVQLKEISDYTLWYSGDVKRYFVSVFCNEKQTNRLVSAKLIITETKDKIKNIEYANF